MNSAQARAAVAYATDPTGVISRLKILSQDPEALFRKVGLIL